MAKNRKKKKAPQYKPLKVHYEETVYGAGVAIVRIPQDTHPVDRAAALKEARRVALQHSINTWY